VHVLVAPDRIGACAASEVAAAIAAGWHGYDSVASLDLVPLSDGGPGLLDVLAAAQVGERHELVPGPALRSPDGTVYVEPATATGPVDELLAAVLSELQPSRVVVGVGGATADHGGEQVGGALRGWPSSVPLAVAAGADPALPSLGERLVALGGTRVSGTQEVVDAVRLADRAAGADLVVTAESVFDGGSLTGRVPCGAAWAAQRAGCPCVVLAGRVLVGRREFAAAGVDAAYELGPSGGVAGSLPERLRASAERVARTWTSGGR
jgi:glycerate 2-kinase